MRQADNSPPERLAWEINRDYYEPRVGKGWMINSDINSSHGHAKVARFHGNLVEESLWRSKNLAWGTSVGRPNVPTWKILDLAIDARIDPGLALECAEFWGFDHADWE